MSASSSPSLTRQAGLVWRAICHVLSLAAVTVLFAMMGLTTADVVARYLFNSPIPGAYELTEIFLVTLIFMALPLATLRGEHVEVELFDPKPGSFGFRVTLCIAVLVVAGVLALMAIELWDHEAKLQRRNTVTNSLDLPYFPLAYFTAAACGLSGLAIVGWALARLKSKPANESDPAAAQAPGEPHA